MDGRVVILGMMCGALSTLAAESNTGRTNVSDNTHNAIPASVSRGLNADMVTPATSRRSTANADEPYRSLCERHYYHSSNGTERTNRASMNTYNLSSCIKKPVYINGMSGLVFLENTPVSQLTECQVTVQVPSDRTVRFQVEICRRMKLEILSKLSMYPSHTDTKDCTVGGSDPQVFYSVMQAPVVKVTLPDLFYRSQLCVQFTAVTLSERPGLKVVSLSSTSGVESWAFPWSQPTPAYVWDIVVTSASNPTLTQTLSAPRETLCEGGSVGHISVQTAALELYQGYVQTAGWDGQTPHSPLMRSCVTLTAPQHTVVFVMFILMALSSHAREQLDIFPGRCVATPHPNTLKTFGPWRPWGMRLPGASIFPDHFNVPDKTRTGPLSFRFTSGVYMPLAGPRIRFSFHPRHSKPRVVMVENRVRWNCSESLWPELAQHFPCDLTPQCAESEDEARCFYTTEKCGLNKAEVGGRCYLQPLDNFCRTFHDCSSMCRLNGGHLPTFETLQKWTEVTRFLKDVHFTPVWIGLKPLPVNAEVPLGFIYKKMWHWESDTVAYFSKIPLIYYKGVCNNLRDVGKRIELVDCPCRNPATDLLLCELNPKRDDVVQSVTISALNTTTVLSLSRVPLMTCPTQHVTHESFVCDQESVCRTLNNTGTWYKNYCPLPRAMQQPYFYCGGVFRNFIPYGLVCDFHMDCHRGADEYFCVHSPCPNTMFDCGQGQCVDMTKRCNGDADCVKNTDEEACQESLGAMIIPPPALVRFELPKGMVISPLPGNDTQCPDSHFPCLAEQYCLPVYLRCNGINDCANHEDEVGCHEFTCPGFYRCRGTDTTICVHVSDLCDGLPQCPKRDDEMMCDLACPPSCACHHGAFTCTNTFDVRSFPFLRYLEARGGGLQLNDLTDNLMLVHLGVQGCGWRNLTDFALPNIHSLDLSENSLSQINFSHFDKMRYLRQLNLAGNPVSSCYFNDQSYLQSRLIVFNLSRTQMLSLDLNIMSAVMPDLEILDFSEGKIESLQGQNIFPNLLILSLRGNPLTKFPPGLMKRMTSLTNIFAENFKLCCSVVLPDNFKGDCSAPFNEISSCDDLLKSNMYRFVLALFTVLAVSGNMCSFFYRLFFGSDRMTTGFAIFVLHLCVSDFFMGVYLAFIGVADLVYADVYIWKEEDWRKSSVCNIAGFLSLLSSEVSAFIICIITLDRFLVLRFPFSQIRFGATSAYIACAIIWTLGFTLALIPLLPATSHWQFYSQTGICIPLPITRADFAGHTYSFSVMIVGNLVLFVLIAVGQSLVHWSIRAAVISKQKTEFSNMVISNDKSKEAVIARRLLTIAMTDFLCWFPIGLCGLLAAVDVAVPGEVNVAMAIFVLPLNSALNPFIYTLNIYLEKRQKAKELRLQKILLARIKMAQATAQS